jgi:hypothetical protein
MDSDAAKISDLLEFVKAKSAPLDYTASIFKSFLL